MTRYATDKQALRIDIFGVVVTPADVEEAQSKGWCAWRLALERGASLDDAELAVKDACADLPASPRPLAVAAPVVLAALALWWRGEASLVQAARRAGVSSKLMYYYKNKLGLALQPRHKAAALRSRDATLSAARVKRERALCAQIRKLTAQGLLVSAIVKTTRRGQALIEAIAAREGVDLRRRSDAIPAVIARLEVEQALPVTERASFARMGEAVGMSAKTLLEYAALLGEQRTKERVQERVAAVLALQASEPGCCPRRVSLVTGASVATLRRDERKGYYKLTPGKRTSEQLLALLRGYCAAHPLASATEAARALKINRGLAYKICDAHGLRDAPRVA